MNTATDKSGKLISELLPAVYFDSSVLIDYWMTEGMEIEDSEDEYETIDPFMDSQLTATVSELLRSDERINKVIDIRKALNNDTKTTPVTSHIALWELQEWIAESYFKQIAAEVSGAIFLQRKGKKEIGEYLKKTYDLWEAEDPDKRHDPKTGASGLQTLMQATRLNLSFAHFHGLAGIVVAEIVNFNWPPKQKRRSSTNYVSPLILGYLQLGLADIMHLLIANHLGCEYFASFDYDFRRARRFIENDSVVKLLTSPEEILAIL